MPDLPPPARRSSPLGPILLALLAFALVGGGIYALRPHGPKPGTPAADPSPAPTAAVGNAPATSPAPGDTPADPGKFQGPKLLTSRPVRYPEQAFLNRVEGVVRVKFAVDDTGKVSKVAVSQSSGSVMLDAMALDYDLKLWTFQPATLDGKPVSGSVDKEFEFHLDPAGQKALAAKRLAAKVGTPDAPYPKEALPLKAQGACTVNVTWTKAGLVDRIYLSKASGSNILDRAALRFAYENWRVEPKDIVPDKEFSKTMTFTPPLGANDTPPPLAADASPAATATPAP